VDDADAAGLRHGDGERASVTVSIAEEMIGMLSEIERACPGQRAPTPREMRR
jgi:hypothetical protein